MPASLLSRRNGAVEFGPGYDERGGYAAQHYGIDLLASEEGVRVSPFEDGRSDGVHRMLREVAQQRPVGQTPPNYTKAACDPTVKGHLSWK